MTLVTARGGGSGLGLRIGDLRETEEDAFWPILGANNAKPRRLRHGRLRSLVAEFDDVYFFKVLGQGL